MMSPLASARGISCKKGISLFLVIKLPCRIGPTISHPSSNKYANPKLKSPKSLSALVAVCKHDLFRMIDHNAGGIVVRFIDQAKTIR
jgi:hypothetical protein